MRDQAIARRMVACKSDDPLFTASIINITSISATVVSVNRGEYCISKAGLSMSVALWAARLAAHGIGVFENNTTVGALVSPDVCGSRV